MSAVDVAHARFSDVHLDKPGAQPQECLPQTPHEAQTEECPAPQTVNPKHRDSSFSRRRAPQYPCWGGGLRLEASHPSDKKASSPSPLAHQPLHL